MRVVDCLAYNVLLDPDQWLGFPSPSALQQFLIGAEWRVVFSRTAMPKWRLWGPLTEPAFDASVVEATSHPELSIRWATALEFLHFSARTALADLKSRIEAFAADHEPSDELVDIRMSTDGPEWLFAMIAGRPAMFLGTDGGLGLENLLNGATRGGDWLGLPAVPRFQEVKELIETESESCYGSRFAGYRAYRDNGVGRLLEWAGFDATKR
ncbi:MAG: hypothetical protein HOW73_22400 [Polyangiaceae bacterium]|nr:hypothetical protein [Polyangiaceae bacterium]